MILKDNKTGQATSYGTTKEEFRKAFKHLTEIESKSGHVAGGDAARIRNYGQQMGWR